MKQITMSDSVEIVDPKLRALVQRIVKKIELATDKVAANSQDPKKFPLSPNPKSFEQIIAARFRTLSDANKKMAVQKALSRINAPKAEREASYGDLAQIDLTKAISVEDQAKALPFPNSLKFSLDYLKSLTNLHGDVLSSRLTVLGKQPQNKSLVTQPVTDKLEFRIHSVECVDRTSDGLFGTEGSDEIRLGGTKVDETGDTGKVVDFSVKTFYKDGEQKTYSPPLRFTSFDLNEGTVFPKSYFVTLVLAEADMGDFSEYLNNFLISIKDEVTAALVAAVSTGIALGSSGGPVGAIIGAAVGAAVAGGIQLIKKITGDEVFTPHTLSCTIYSLNGTWDGSTDSPEHITTFIGYNGIYELKYDWRKYA
ncbi:MAG: hypothetical protein ICV53_23215 [Flavisolibacter sp.]|nr:hypothetical protein [Flavisolibacter sp.]